MSAGGGNTHFTIEVLQNFAQASEEVSAHTVEGARDLSEEQCRLLLGLYMHHPMSTGRYPDPNYKAQGLAFNNGDMMVVFTPYAREGRGSVAFLLYRRIF